MRRLCISLQLELPAKLERKPVDNLNNGNKTESKTKSAEAAKAIFVPSKTATLGWFWPLLPTRSNFYGSKWLVQLSRTHSATCFILDPHQ